MEEKTALLRHLGDRLKLLNSHDALVLLRYSLAIPKLLYSLRSTPCFAVSSLCDYDNVLCSVLSNVTNCDLSAHQSAWVQSSLPVKMGGLGIRSAVHLAPSAFLASSAASVSLVQCIIPPSLHSLPLLFREASSSWRSGCTCLLNTCSQLLIVNFSVLVASLTGLRCILLDFMQFFLRMKILTKFLNRPIH